jgi:hypothetical protein
MANSGLPPGGYPSGNTQGASRAVSSRGWSSPEFENQKTDPNYVPDEASAVALTDVPTSSTNYGRPRTLAAGYDPKTKTMTVVFRDGTYYNYYGVMPNEWLNFSASYSKGRPWLNRGFPSSKNPNAQRADGLFIAKDRGPASPTTVAPEVRAALERVQAGMHTGPKRSDTYDGRREGWEYLNDGKSFRKRTGYIPRKRSR